MSESREKTHNSTLRLLGLQCIWWLYRIVPRCRTIVTLSCNSWWILVLSDSCYGSLLWVEGPYGVRLVLLFCWILSPSESVAEDPKRIFPTWMTPLASKAHFHHCTLNMMQNIFSIALETNVHDVVKLLMCLKPMHWKAPSRMVNWNQLQNVLLKEGGRDELGLIQIVQACWKTDIRTLLPDARFHIVTKKPRQHLWIMMINMMINYIYVFIDIRWF